MVKKDGRRYEVELDWYYISKDTVVRWVLIFLVAAAAVAGGVYFFVQRGADVSRRAAREISQAEDLLVKARTLPDASRVREEVEIAAGKIQDARGHYQAGRYQEALAAAVEARSLAQRILGGGGSLRHDAMVMDFGGKLEVQRANRSTWEPARVGMKLYEGDFLKTGANGLAEVMSIDGTYYRIKPETLFEVHRVSTIPGSGGADARRRSEIKFIVGTVEVNTGEGASSIVRTDAATAEIAQRSAVGVDVDQSKATGVSNYRGSVVVSAGGASPVTLGERERAVARLGGGISERLRLPNTPSPLGPDDSAVYEIKRKDPIRLRWSPVKDVARYRLQIARSRLFIPDSIVVVDDRPRPEADVRVVEDGSFFWRVASLKGNLASEWSATRRFKVVAAGPRGGPVDTTPPDLVLQRPQVNGTIVIVAGRSEPGCAVSVDGEPVDLDPSGNFRKVISMSREGINTVVVKAVDGAGNETVRRENVVVELF